MRKLLAIFIFGIMLLAPVSVLAEETIPEFNNLCWRKQQCLDIRAKLFANGRPYEKLTDAEKVHVAEGFKQEEPCASGDWGKCLPASTAKTMIAFGGKPEFINIGDFIQSNYNYVLSIAAIIAVVMIIVAGFQWVTSGGNSEAISSAKTRIGGALIGLFIAYTSYFILQTISPNLVNLRLPQTWMVRPQPMIPQFCMAAPSTTAFFKVAGKEEQTKTIAMTESISYDIKYDQINDQSVFDCGSRFYMEKGGDRACFGNVCGKGFVCANFDDKGSTRNKDTVKQNPYDCKKGTVIGNIFPPVHLLIDTSDCLAMVAPGISATRGWQSPDPTDPGEQELWVICKNGSNHEVQSAVAQTLESGNGQQYIIAAEEKAIDETANKCGSENVLGFVLTFEMQKNCNPNDQTHVIGRIGGGGIDLGPDDYFPINGKSASFSQVKQMIDAKNLEKYFIPHSEIKSVIMDISADKVYHIESSAGWDVYKSL